MIVTIVNGMILCSGLVVFCSRGQKTLMRTKTRVFCSRGPNRINSQIASLSFGNRSFPG